MIYLSGASLAINLILIAALVFRESANTLERTMTRDASDQLVQSLADRVQHPEVRQVQPGPVVDHEPPTDAAELAYVGQEVPEFVSVGSDD